MENINYNILAYLIYLPITFYITIYVGKVCYKNGEVFIFKLVQNEQTTKAVNKLLLVGYYLLNLGFAALTLSYWSKIEHWHTLIEVLCTKLGQIILLLGIMHFNNMFIIQFFAKKQLNNSFH
jgi:hypothetical protein